MPRSTMLALVLVACDPGPIGMGPDAGLGGAEDGALPPNDASTSTTTSTGTAARDAGTAHDGGAHDTGVWDAGLHDAGTQTSSACGFPGTVAGAECQGLGDCGAGNFEPVSFCDNCLHRADRALCDDGVCRPFLPTHRVNTQIVITPSAQGASTYTLASIAPVATDGTLLTCADLLTTCTLIENPKLNVVRSNFFRFINQGGVDGARVGSVYPVFMEVEEGPGQILLLRVTEDQQGKGAVLAVACLEGIDVVEDTALEPMTLVAP